MSAAPPLVSLRTWYNDSADAESKAACAALQPLKRLIIPTSHGSKIKCRYASLDFLRSWEYRENGERNRKMRHSIRKQFAMIFIGLLAGTLGLSWIINSFFLEKYYIYSKEEKINYAYEKINRATGSESKTNVNALQELTITCFQDNIYAAVIDLDSKRVYASPNGGEEFLTSVMIYRIGG